MTTPETQKRCSPYCNCPKCAKCWMMDETVMPDGRPLFAWRNELEMLRQKEQRANDRLKEAHGLARLAGIAKVYREQNPYNLEMVIRVRFERYMTNDSRDPFDSAEIS